MENKMPLLGKIKCRNLWKILYHLQESDLYEKYGLSEDEIATIENLIKPMD